MNHPELLAVPVLMLADYMLTILSAKEASVRYRKHFALASYELNPLWRQSVDQLRWFNPRHLTLVCLLTVFLLFVDTVAPRDMAFELLLGALFGAWGMICGRHLTNLLIFRYLKRHPDEVSGQVQLSMLFTLKMSQYTYLGIVPLLVAIALLSPSGYTAGVALGVAILAGVHTLWALKTPVAPEPLDLQKDQPAP